MAIFRKSIRLFIPLVVFKSTTLYDAYHYSQSAIMVKSVLQLRCGCNEYPWGKQGSESISARLCSKTPGTSFKIDESKSYSEMWMGTYPELPSYVLETGENLQDVINSNPTQLIGRTVQQKFGLDLPFLPKVLSIAKALPLQVHPVCIV
jgi:mannose-6-phosphate isomerase